MSALLDRITGSGEPFVWLNDDCYTERAIVRGPLPWLHLDELIALRRKASSLLHTTPNVLPVETVTNAWLAADPDRAASLRGRTRTTAPLRGLLEADGLRSVLGELADGMRASFTASPFVLAVPSPRHWLVSTYRAVFGTEPEPPDDDQIDTSAVYVADFLRIFAEREVAGIVLRECPGDEPRATESGADWYQPVLNVARHYQWSVGEEIDRSSSAQPAALPGRDFVLASAAQPDTPTGQRVTQAFWDGSEPPEAPPGGFHYAQVPADIVPEDLLERLKTLRGR